MSEERSSAMPDEFDRLLGSLEGLPDVTKTKPSTMRTVTPLLGTSQMYIVQTYRRAEIGDTIFLECVDRLGSTRIALPPSVADAIARQRDAITGMVRSKHGKRIAQERKLRGDTFGFEKRRPARKKKAAKK